MYRTAQRKSKRWGGEMSSSDIKRIQEWAKKQGIDGGSVKTKLDNHPKQTKPKAKQLPPASDWKVAAGWDKDCPHCGAWDAGKKLHMKQRQADTRTGTITVMDCYKCGKEFRIT